MQYSETSSPLLWAKSKILRTYLKTTQVGTEAAVYIKSIDIKSLKYSPALYSWLLEQNTANPPLNATVVVTPTQ